MGVEFDSEITGEVLGKLIQEGVLMNAPAGNVLRFMPPLVMTEEEVDEVVGKLAKVLDEVKAKPGRPPGLSRPKGQRQRPAPVHGTGLSMLVMRVVDVSGVRADGGRRRGQPDDLDDRSQPGDDPRARQG